MTKNDQNFQWEDNLICIYWMPLKEDRTRDSERNRAIAFEYILNINEYYIENS